MMFSKSVEKYDKWKYFLVVRPSPFFFVYCRTRFLILGGSVGKEKKKKQKKNVKGVISVSLETTRRGYKVNMVAMEEGKIDIVVKLKREQ